MALYVRASDGAPRTARYVREWINRVDLPDPFTLQDIAPYGWVEYTPLPEPPLSIDEARASARQAVNFWRDQQEVSGFTALGHNWDSTPTSREKLLAVLVSGTNPLGYWTSAADVDVPVTLQDLQALYTAMLTKGAQIHARQREMKAAIETMTLAQLAAFSPDWA